MIQSMRIQEQLQTQLRHERKQHKKRKKSMIKSMRIQEQLQTQLRHERKQHEMGTMVKSSLNIQRY